jgi:hypothetical protein
MRRVISDPSRDGDGTDAANDTARNNADFPKGFIFNIKLALIK